MGVGALPVLIPGLRMRTVTVQPELRRLAGVEAWKRGELRVADCQRMRFLSRSMGPHSRSASRSNVTAG